METVKMKKFSLSLILVLVLGCSTNSNTDGIDHRPLLLGTWHLLDISNNGNRLEVREFCDHKQTLSFNDSGNLTLYLWNGNDAQDCTFKAHAFNFTVSGNVISLTREKTLVKLRILENKDNDLKFKFFYHTQEEGEYDGEIWHCTRLDL